jgi:acetolactate synthase I/II/III large subunit
MSQVRSNQLKNQKSRKMSVGRRGFMKGVASGAAGLAAGIELAPAQAPQQGAGGGRGRGNATAPAPDGATLARENGAARPVSSGRVVEHPGSDFMVDLIRSLGIEYAACNPGSSFEGLHESIVN